MKQGSGNSRVGDTKVEPRAHAIRPAGVAQLGQAQGNHAQDSPGRRLDPTEAIHKGRGYEAPPLAGCTPHHSGSQGRHR